MYIYDTKYLNQSRCQSYQILQQIDKQATEDVLKTQISFIAILWRLHQRTITHQTKVLHNTSRTSLELKCSYFFVYVWFIIEPESPKTSNLA